MPRQQTPPIHVHEIRSEDDATLRPAYRLLRRTFPAAELLPLEDWLDWIRERSLGLWIDVDWHLLVATRGERVVGVASGLYLGSANIGLVGYVVADRALRGQRIGTRLRQRLQAGFRRSARRLRGSALRAMVGEVHRDNPWLRHLVRAEGAIALDFPYYQPPIPGRGPPIPFVLYYQSLNAQRSWLAPAEVRRLVFALWRRPYRVPRPLSQPLFRKMLESLKGRRRIGQMKL